VAQKKKADPLANKYRSRIVEFLPAFPTADLIEHPDNWRLHPEQQKQMLAGLLDRYGKIDAIIAYRSEKYGGLVIIDGHQRHGMDAMYPVLVIDVTDQEASEILMTYNPLAEMSTTDKESYRQLMSSIDDNALRESKSLAKLAEYVMGESVIVSETTEDAVLKRVDVKSPPRYVWAVIGVPVADFGSVNSIIEQLGIIEGVIIETTASDWKPPCP
jgi:hypothetical protein